MEAVRPMVNRDGIKIGRISTSVAAEQARGWTASVLIHTMAMAGALLLMAEINKPILQETFRWNVAMVEAPTRSESAPAEPVVQPPPSPVKPNPPIQQPSQPIAQRPKPPTREAVAPVETTRVVKDVAANAEPVMEYAAAVESTESQIVTSQAVVAEPVAFSAAQIVEQAAPVESATPTFEQRTVQYRQVRYRETRADYGWLRDTLWSRIEELKRYPAQARMNHWEGKVVVEAVIRDDGEVVRVKIAETSGRAVLDEEAMAVMKKASPLTLKHPLGKRHITLLIPINYRLDG
ncbi:MAG: energy transducer TonB [Nitrospira sp.]